MRLRFSGIVLVVGVIFASFALRASPAQDLPGVCSDDLEGVSSFDKNQNGFVCAYDLRGTRAYNDDPYFNFTWFGVSDDKIRK